MILDLLNKYIEGKTLIIRDETRHNSQIIHYYNEIIRNWNKLNFIIKKTLRSFESASEYKTYKIELLIYATYRLLFEVATNQEIINELNLKNSFLPFLAKLRKFSWKLALKDKNQYEKLSIKRAIPTFFIKRLEPVMDIKFLKENIDYMNQYDSHKKVSFRINTLSSSNSLKSLINEVKKELNEKSISFSQDKDIPYMFHVSLKDKRRVLLSNLHKKGFILFQDKASSAIVELLAPQSGEFICDMCTAPGIKSSLIAQLSKNETKIICNDFNLNRLVFSHIFLKFLKASNYLLLNSDGTNLPIRLNTQFDKILIDAPCTGSGTFLLNPELKWRQNYKFLNQNLIIQEKLIKSGLKFLKKNGILVYSTCSLYPEEGENQMIKFKEFLEPLDLPRWISPSYKIEGSIINGTGRLFPAIHHTQGFFVGKFKKKET